MITSTHNPRIQLVRDLLGRSKERHQAGAFVAEGVRLVEEALAARWPFRFVLAGESLSARGERLVEGLRAQQVEVEAVADPLLRSISETGSSQGLLAILEEKALPIPALPDFVLILDQIRDPGNLGTLLRTAAAAGVQVVFLPPETTDAFAPKVVRAGMGAHFFLPIHALPWAEIGKLTKDLSIHLADMDGPLTCWQADFREPLALIVGGEAEGASSEAHHLAASRIRIPMPGRAESLNAAVSGALLMYEVLRQRTVGTLPQGHNQPVD